MLTHPALAIECDDSDFAEESASSGQDGEGTEEGPQGPEDTPSRKQSIISMRKKSTVSVTGSQPPSLVQVVDVSGVGAADVAIMAALVEADNEMDLNNNNEISKSDEIHKKSLNVWNKNVDEIKVEIEELPKRNHTRNLIKFFETFGNRD